MSRRLPVDAEHPAYDAGACGPDGHALCRRCLREIHIARNDGCCSEACRHEILMRVSPSYARAAVFARDQGVCTHCRTDCGRLDRIMRHLCASGGEDDPESGQAIALEFIAELGFGRRRRVISLWQADHRLPIAEGGRDCGLGNYRTLCLACHAIQTRAMHRRMRDRRLAEA